ncbi:E3 ubiquitin-protein ligase TRIM45-like isoform X1 [Acropora palmata]|uniref:E3 ubiquitin-protein ligase TRIM45-like isoform X1 n=1 Tax=Acropora palmata TaxID=6131 RepID=UPI003DA1B26E
MDVQQLFKSLKKEAECPLCLDTVENPKTLPCLHSFCQECLEEMANFARGQQQETINCPVCQTSFPIPETDTIANLPSPFYLNRLVDVLALEDGNVQAQKCDSCDENNPATSYCFVCQSFLCATCFLCHQRLKVTRGHRNVLIKELQAQDVLELIHRPTMCSQRNHEDQALEFYCEDCKVLICQKCCDLSSHNQHNVTDAQKAAQEEKIQMAEAVTEVKSEILVYENEIKKQTELKNKTIAEIINAEKKMADTVEEAIRNSREHEREMKDRILVFHLVEEEKHTMKLESLELKINQMRSCVEQGQSILERSISAEILRTNSAILERCNELLRVRKPVAYKSPNVNYLFEEKLDLDQIVTKTDPSMCLIEGHDCEMGKEWTFVVVTRDSEGLQCYQQDDEIKIDILTPEGDHLKPELKDRKDGKYKLTYTPQCVGRHKVEIRVNEQPLTGSILLVHDRQHHYQFDFTFGAIGRRGEEFDVINDIAVNHKTGTIAVADSWNERVQLFSSDGKFQRQVKLDGKPFSVAFTKSGDLLVLLPFSNNKLRLLSKKDGANNKVKVLSSDGNDLLLSFSASNSDEYPDCAVYHKKKFYVCYPGAHCIKMFDETGVYLRDIGCKGSNDGQFDRPRGLVIDKYNRLIVCDVNNRRLQLFSLSGKFLGKLEGEYFENVKPSHAGINNNGNLFVAGSWSCISVFR